MYSVQQKKFKLKNAILSGSLKRYSLFRLGLSVVTPDCRLFAQSKRLALTDWLELD